MTHLIRTAVALSLLALASTGALSSAHATQVGRGRNFGLGIQFGSPTAFTGKYFMGGGNALAFGLGVGGWGWGHRWCRDSNGNRYDCGHGYQDFGLYGDYLWQSNLVRDNVNLDWHVGVGGLFWFVDAYDSGFGNDVAAIARVPLGLDLSFNNRADFVEVYAELVPGVLLVPRLRPVVDAAIGVRLFF